MISVTYYDFSNLLYLAFYCLDLMLYTVLDSSLLCCKVLSLLVSYISAFILCLSRIYKYSDFVQFSQL